MNKAKYKEVIIACVLILGAFVFRMWFIRLSPQPFYWDQDEYQSYALKMYNSPFFLAAHSYRSYPWPMVMTILYKLFGWANHEALYIFNAVLDSVSACFVYFFVKKITHNVRPAVLAGMLYAVNPFTSGYVGMGLSEVLTAFFIITTLYFGIRFTERPKAGWGILLGFCAGMAAETRNAAFAWAAVPIFLTVFFVPLKKQAVGFVGIAFGVLLTVLYPLYTNWVAYKQISITKVDSFYAMEFYNGATLKILPPFTLVYPPEQHVMWGEYYSEFYPGRTSKERAIIAQKYWKKAWDIIVKDPADYIRWRFFKMWYVWQKENIFFIKEPNYESHRLFTYYGNQMLLLLAAAGLCVGWIKYRHPGSRYGILSMIGTIAYCTFAFSFSHAEYRLTVPFYAVILAPAGISMYSCILLIQKSLLYKKTFRR